VKKIGEGMSRDIFVAEVQLAGGASERYVVALPRHDAEPGLVERVRRAPVDREAPSPDVPIPPP